MTMLGLTCLGCEKISFKTIETRPIKDGVRRRKECVYCGARITTIERDIARPAKLGNQSETSQ